MKTGSLTSALRMWNKMREIKFRAWDKEKKRMVIVASYEFLPFSGDTVIQWDNEKQYRESGVIEERLELMQFTGLHDKNGKEIYEGDIRQFDTTDLRMKELHYKFKGDVRYNYCMFYIVDTSNDVPYNIYNVYQHIEVIGNIHENPELLKE